MHVRRRQVVLLVPGRCRQHDIRMQRRRSHPEIEGEQQVDLALGCLVAPVDVAWAQMLRRLLGRYRVVDSEEVLEEVLVALGRGAQGVRPPHRPDTRIVVRSIGVLGGEAQSAGLELVDDVLGAGLARLAGRLGDVEGIVVEGRIVRLPAQACRLGDGIGGGHALEFSVPGPGREHIGPELVIAPLIGVHVPVRRLGHLPRRAHPVQSVGQVQPPGEGADLLLPDVMGPAAAVDPLSSAQRCQGEEGAVGLIRVEPVVRARTHDDHRPALRITRIGGEFTADAGRGLPRHTGDRLLPGRGVRTRRILIVLRPRPGQAGPAHPVFG